MTPDEQAACECIAEALASGMPPVLEAAAGEFFHGTNAANAAAIVAEQRWILPKWEMMQNVVGPSVCVFCNEPPVFPGESPAPSPACWGEWGALEFARMKIENGRLAPPPAVVRVELRATPVLDLNTQANRPFLAALRAALGARSKNLRHMYPQARLEHMLTFAINRGRAGFPANLLPGAVALRFPMGQEGCKQKGLAILEPGFIVRARPGSAVAFP